MAMPEDKLGSVSELFDPPAPARRPGRERRPPRAPKGAGDISDLFDAPEPDAPRASSPRAAAPAAPAAPAHPHGAFDSLTDGRWSISHADGLRSWFRQTYGRELPVTAAGQSGTHNRMGLDHSDSLDVGINPATEEGARLREYLRAQRVPFLAYDRAVPGAATGPHIHIGFPSRGGAAGGAARLGSISDLFDGPDLDSVSHLFDAAEPGAPAPPAAPLAPLQIEAEPGRLFDPATDEGRELRDADRAGRAQPGARRVVTLRVDRAPTPDDTPALLTAAIVKDAATRGVPEDFARVWITKHPEALQAVNTSTGARASVPFDSKRGEVQLAVRSGAYIEKEWKESRGSLGRAADLLTDPTTSLGEKALGAASGAASAVRGVAESAAATPEGRNIGAAFEAFGEPVLNAVDAGDSYVMAKALGYGDQTARMFAEMTFAGVENPASNPGGELLANVPVLRNSPKYRAAARAFGDFVLKPSNLVPLPEVGALLKAGRLGRAVEEGGELAARVARAAGVMDRGLVERAPLGLADDAAAAVVARGDDGAHYLVDLGKREAVNLDTGAAAAADDFDTRRAFEEWSGSADGRGKASPEGAEPPTPAAQLEDLKAGRRSVVQVPAGERVVYNPEMVGREEAVRGVDSGTLDELGRRVGPKPDESADAAGKIEHLFDAPAPEPAVRPAAEVAADIRTTHARERADFYAAQAAGAKDPAARAEFESLARDYADEAEAARVSDVARRVKEGAEVAPDELADLERAVLAEDGEPVYIEVDAAAAGAPAAPAARAPRPSRSPLRRAFDAGLDAFDATKSLFASADLSAAGRQAFVPFLFDTRATARGLLEGTPSVLARRHGDFARWLDTNPAAKMWAGMGLDLDTLTGGHNEFFTSHLAEKIPLYGPGVIQPSDRAMTAQLDAVRLSVAESWAKDLKAAGLTPAKNPEEYKAVAKLINAASGRAELGRVGQAIYPVTRRVIFSPKLLKSRFTMVNPLTYSRLPPTARRVAGRRLGKAAAKLAGVLGLACLTADSVGLDPARGDFMHARFGNTTYDLSGGFANKLRFVFRLVQSAGTTANAYRKGESVEYKETPLGVATHFLRSQLAPSYSLPVDAFLGETYDGKPFSWGEGVVRRLAPGFAQDVYEGFAEGGAVGALKALPSFVGVSTRTRDREELKREWARARVASRRAEAKERTADVMKGAPAEVRDELVRLGVRLSDSDAGLSGRIAEAVRLARAGDGWGRLDDRQRRTFLENVIAGIRKEAGLPSAARGQAEERAKDGERLALTGAAAAEVERLGVVVDPVFAGHKVGVMTGESVGFRGEHLGQTPEQLGEYRRKLAEDTQRELERVMGFDGYAAASEEVKRSALQAAVDRVKRADRGPFHHETRGRDFTEYQNLEEYQRRLEGRSRQVRPGETLKLGEGVGVTSNRLNFDGLRESTNVEDLRGGQTVEDAQVLADEVGDAGAPQLTEVQAADAALLLDSLDDEQFAGLARSLDEYQNSGVLRPLEGLAARAFEYGAEGLARVNPSRADAHRKTAEAARVLRLLAEERAERPVQFTRDALAGRYGSKLRAEAAEGVYYPENHLPAGPDGKGARVERGKPLGVAGEDVRRAVDAADPEAEPTFREFPEGAGDSRIPRASMPQIEGRHRGAMVMYLRGRGIAHTRETVPAGSLRPSQAEWSPEKVRRALGYDGPERALLVSSDGHVADGHHQWLSKLYRGKDTPVEVIRLDAPIQQLLLELARMPASGVDDASA